MSKQRKSLDSAIKSKLDKDKELPEVKEATFDPQAQVMERFEGWLVTLKKRFPLESEKKLKERAAELACLNRKERRRVFKHSSPKLPKYLKVPRGKQ